MKFFKEYKLVLIPFFIAFLFFLTAVAFYFHTVSKQKKLVSPLSQDSAELGFKNLPTPASEKIYNVLLLGHGDPGHPGGDLADSLILVHLDTERKKVVLISVPRDTWLSLPMGGNRYEPHKINEAYSVGKKAKNEEFGFSLIKQAITKVTNLPVNYYVFVSFGKFMEIIDTLEGIEVDVPHSFDDYFYPIRGKELDLCGMSSETIEAINATMSGFQLEKQYDCRYEHLYFEKGKTEMNGETALKFVRSRHSSQYGGDFARAERQQAVILGIKDRLLSLEALKKAPEVYELLAHLVKTDLNADMAVAVAELVINPEEYTITRIILSTENVFNDSRNFKGQFVLIPKAGEDRWEAIHQLILRKLDESE